eukprot:CAMPEP_0170503862 /NCGR_PEP_ID=MMETSP0208-20121228/46130_1 /TAXON_ID=197538 /ORGANISM="Strombidium inclinatum, Strain S3" /LENGTH=164 /DNA_ID=CAMNT_0010783747 /DNA_START=1044 /DNA_END=1538 /DNA_ORIENTATION=+
MRSFQVCLSDIRESSRLVFDSRIFEGLSEYFFIGLPLLFVLVLDYWGWEYMTLASGFIGITEQAAQVVLINMAALAYMVGYGIQSTITTLVGSHIGRGQASKAKEYYRASLIAMVMNILVLIGLHYKFWHYIVGIFTDIDDVVEEALGVMPWFLVNLIPDSARG